MEPQPTERAIVATFQKSLGKRLTLFSVVVVTPEVGRNGATYFGRTLYDVEFSRQTNCYLYDQSGFGGGRAPEIVDGVYFVSGNITIKEEPCKLVGGNRKTTRAIKALNRTRRLRRLPKAFNLEPGMDLMCWLRRNAIEDDGVYCAKCRDHVPGQSMCDHVWWCEKTHWYSTPSERCGCASRDECRGD